MKEDNSIPPSDRSPPRVDRRDVALLFVILAGCGSSARADGGGLGGAESAAAGSGGSVAGAGGSGGSGGTVFIMDAILPDVGGPSDGRSDDDAPPSRGCADQQARDRYQACLSARDEQPCRDNGGSWIWLGCLDCGGLCDCFPPDDSDCVCTQASDCFNYCLWSPSDPRLKLDVTSCASIGEGRCDAPYDVNGWVVIDTPGMCLSGPVRDH
jgi:hypothetical protein